MEEIKHNHLKGVYSRLHTSLIDCREGLIDFKTMLDQWMHEAVIIYEYLGLEKDVIPKRDKK